MRRYFYVHPIVYQYSGTKKEISRAGHAPLLGTYTYLVLRTWYQSPYRLRTYLAKGPVLLIENGTQWLSGGTATIFHWGNPTHSGILHTAPPPTWSPTGYVGRVRGGGRVLRPHRGVWGGRMYDRNKTCRSSKTLLRGRAAYWKALHGSP